MASLLSLRLQKLLQWWMLTASVATTAVFFVSGHGTMIEPTPRQPESENWYQVGCMIGCLCSGSGKESYPSPESVGCDEPSIPTNVDPAFLTFNARGESPKGSWNDFMPWRRPGSSVPIDACGIASGFVPDATVQYPHRFSSSSSSDNTIVQGARGTELPQGMVTRWEAGAVVDTSFYLTVNHGGGYQYRVCPTHHTLLDEHCFASNPLVFADGVHTVTVATTSSKQQQRTIEIPATDIDVALWGEPSSPTTTSTWRRIPIPACNCDYGTACKSVTEDDYTASYTTSSTTNDGSNDNDASASYGDCPTGLQFVPPHISEGLWPEGYGYYVSKLGGGSNNNSNKQSVVSKSRPCAQHLDSSTCHDDTVNGCKWYTEKNVCYETRATAREDIATAANANTTANVACETFLDEDSCQSSSDGGGCVWYQDDFKQTCYDPNAAATTKKDAATTKKNTNNSNTKTVARSDGEWHITDRVYAPTEPGEYVLQWRWDNEQTPQIWTTCADIQVVEAEAEAAAAAGNTPSGGSSSSSTCLLVATTMVLGSLFYV